MTPEEFPIDLNVTPDFRGNCVLTTDFGIGLGYLGAQERDAEGKCQATKWFVFLGMPIWPISRDLIRPRSFTTCRQSQQFRYDWFASEEILIGEVLQVLMFHWIFAPIFVGIIPVPIYYNYESLVGWLFRWFRAAGAKFVVDEPVRLVVGGIGIGWLIFAVLFLRHKRLKKLLGNVRETLTRIPSILDEL